jgi:hypothetical protein
MRLLICGGRDLKLCTDEIQDAVWKLRHKEDIVLIHGCATGADDAARRWAEDREYETDAYPACWKQYGKAAGPIRNTQMLTEGKPDVVIAFWDLKSKGTKDMINKSLKANVSVLIMPQWEG